MTRRRRCWGCPSDGCGESWYARVSRYGLTTTERWRICREWRAECVAWFRCEHSAACVSQDAGRLPCEGA